MRKLTRTEWAVLAVLTAYLAMHVGVALMTKVTQELIDAAKAKMDAMSPEERAAMFEAQKASWVRGETDMGSDRDEASYRAAMGHKGKFTVQYCQGGSWPDRFWWYEIHDGDGHNVAQCQDKGVADFIVDRINGR